MNKFYLIIIVLLLPFLLNGKSLEIKGLSKLSINDLQTLTSVDLNRNNLTNAELSILIEEIYDNNLIYDLNLIELPNKFILEVEENNLIQNIYFNSNSWIDDEMLFSSINSKQNTLVSKKNISNDIKTINMIYKSKGFYDVSTVAKLENFSEDRVNLIFEIHEGKRSKINSLKFYGNKSFSGRFLSTKINSQDLKFYNFFKSGSNLNRDIFNFDSNIIEKLYKDRGFLDVKVSYEIDKGFLGNHSLKFYIIEGVRYKIDDISYSSILDKDIIY